jgi:hypothetical protein
MCPPAPLPDSVICTFDLMLQIIALYGTMLSAYFFTELLPPPHCQQEILY